QSFGVDAHTDIFAGREKRLTEPVTILQLPNGFLTDKHLGGRSRLQQPARQHLLAGARAEDREQFEQRSLSEEIEVARVGMGIVDESLTRFAGSRPAIFES